MKTTTARDAITFVLLWTAGCAVDRAHPGSDTTPVSTGLMTGESEARLRPSVPSNADAPDEGSWPYYGGDAGGSRYSPLDEIDRDNVTRLEAAWEYRTGDYSDGSGGMRESKFQATPILFGGKLIFSTPFSRIIALDPATGRELWVHDPEIDLYQPYSESLVSRGVAAWRDEPPGAGQRCASRILFATLDARLLALDADDGTPCPGFGNAGYLDLTAGIGPVEVGEYQVTSPPVVLGHVVIVGSAIGDNRRVRVERGTVRGFDARSGDMIWSFDPIPRSADQPGWDSWSPGAAAITGAANAWSVMSADPARDLVFVPTGSPAPDFYGGERPGDNLFANSVVALRGSTGDVVWHFQVVHHDVWDYDVASQPVLTTVQRASPVPAVVVNTKMGHVFVLDRITGEPLFPVEERPVPGGGVAGEVLSPTQPFPVLPPPLHPTTLTAADFAGLDAADRASCSAQLARQRHDGPFTPPSLEGTLLYPGYGGAVNWGSAAVDPRRSVMFVNVNQVPFWVRLHPRHEYDRRAAASGRAGSWWCGICRCCPLHPSPVQFTAQDGTPYGMSRSLLRAESGRACRAAGKTAAVDLNTGGIVWEASSTSATLGGAIATAGGLVFVSGATDRTLRALDSDSGAELWRGQLPAAAQATPMTYRAPGNGRQYVVVAAGDPGGDADPVGDALVAFRLP